MCSISVRLAEKIEKRYLSKAICATQLEPHTHLKKYFTQKIILCYHSLITNCVYSQLLPPVSPTDPSSHLKLNTHSLNTPQYSYDNRVITDLYVGERGKGSEGVWIHETKHCQHNYDIPDSCVHQGLPMEHLPTYIHN